MADRETSFVRLEGMPSAILSDGLATVPLYAVTAMTISETYHLPPIGSASSRVLVDTHSDTISLSGLLLGPSRFGLKLTLETIAESGKRGGAGLTAGLSALGLDISGVILVTAMTIRTDLQVQQLTFAASAAKRNAIDVNIQLAHLPPPGARAKLLDIGSMAVSTMAGW
jgi:hypothetical protein